MLTFGTFYINKITNGFTLVPHVLIIWILYSISVFITTYNIYLKDILVGKGSIKESRKVIVFSRMAYFVIAYALLMAKCGLISIVIANIIFPLCQRFLFVKYFYDKTVKNEFKKYKVQKDAIKKYFLIIWHNTKKLGVAVISGVLIDRSGLFFAGLFLSLKEIASYGLMNQLVGVIASISLTMFTIYMPKFVECRTKNDISGLIKYFSLTVGIFYTLYILFSICLVLGGPLILMLIKSNASLPGALLLVLYLIQYLLENNHTAFTHIILTNNIVPFAKPAFITAFFVVLGTYIVLRFFDFGLLGIILVPIIAQLCYVNWKWPNIVCNEFELSFFKFIKLSFYEAMNHFLKVMYGFNKLFNK
jgi:O-antigen/teichoic acid export membrane protein